MIDDDELAQMERRAQTSDERWMPDTVLDLIADLRAERERHRAKLGQVMFYRKARHTHSIPFRTPALEDLEAAAKEALPHLPPGSEIGWEYHGLGLDEVRKPAMDTLRFRALANPRAILDLLAELQDTTARCIRAGDDACARANEAAELRERWRKLREWLDDQRDIHIPDGCNDALRRMAKLEAEQ